MTENRSDGYLEDKNGNNPNTGPDEEVDVRCGYGDCTPTGLQSCNTPKVLLFVLCIWSITHGFIVNGIHNVNTQSLERRFGLTSANVGLISSSQDFASGVFGIVLAFIGSGAYKARWLVAGSISAGVGCAVMVLPHYLTGLYDWGQYTVIPTCLPNSTRPESCVDSDLQDYMGVFLGGMCLLGFGSATQYTIGVCYLDDSVPANTSPLYLGTLYGISIFGPAIGYVAGGISLATYVDFDKVDTSQLTLKLEDPRWVGAWWPPFFVAMAMFFVVAFPLSCFGAEMPTAKEVRRTRISQTHKAPSNTKAAESHGTQRPPIRMFPRITWKLLTNAPFILIVLSAIPSGIMMTGLATFLPKFMQNRFNLSSVSAAIATGAIGIPGAAGGTFLGGFVCNRMQLKVRGMLVLSIVAALLTMAFMAAFWVGCDKVVLVGISAPYGGDGMLNDDVIHPCNSDCICSTKYYGPVCTEDGNYQYFSACHAGCLVPSADLRTFYNCSCIPLTKESQSTSVEAGECDSDCTGVYLFSVLFFVSTVFSFMAITPGDAATLRCIDEEHRTFSMGLKQLLSRFLGTVPGPLVYGAVTDNSCSIWQSVCGKDTSCWIYDENEVSRNYFILSMAMKLLSIVFLALALYVYQPPPDDVSAEMKHSSENNVTSEVHVNEGLELDQI